MNKFKTELLLPAGNLENLYTAFLYGADAVYCGMPTLSLRAKAGLTYDELKEGIDFAHKNGKKVYLAMNLFADNNRIKAIENSVETIKLLSPDGLIIADAGVFSVIRKSLPDMHITVSTQANISNSEAVRFWKNAGANRVVLARECSFDDICEIRAENKDIEIECFVHGAMCMAISGRCLISNFLSNRGANQGECSQSCRWNYRLNRNFFDGCAVNDSCDTEEKSLNTPHSTLHTENTPYFLKEETRPDEQFEIYEEDGFSHILSSKDLCLMPVLDKYLEIGIDSFKIEGRHKNAFYIASVARAYRLAINNAKSNMEMLYSVRNRGYTLGFHNGKPTELSTDYETTKSLGEYQFAGVVRECEGNSIIFEVRNTLNRGDKLEFLQANNSENIEITLNTIIDAKSGKEIERASAGQGFCIKITDERLAKLPKFSVAKIKCEAYDDKLEIRKEEFAKETRLSLQ